MKDVTTTLSQVRERLLNMIKADYTVLVGHSLECDLNAMKICHTKVVDSAVMYPHRQGRPYKNKLRYLTKTYLKREIQQSEKGHDSGEDARAALDLIRLKLSKGASFGIPEGAKAMKSMFTTLDTNAVRSFFVYNSTEEKIGNHIIPDEVVTSQPCTNDLAVLQYTLKLMNEAKKKTTNSRKTLIFSCLRNVPGNNDDSSSGSMNMMMKLVDTIPLNGVLVVVSRVSDPNIVRQESQKRWKSRREQIWTSDDEKNYRKMIRSTQDTEMIITFRNKRDDKE